MHKAFCVLAAAAGIFGGSAAVAETIIMEIKSTSYEIELVDNAYAQDLLSILPQTLVFENFGRNERIAELSKRIGQASYKNALEVKRGDLTYYVPWGNLAAFRVDYLSPNDLAPLGHMSEEAITALEHSGDQEVILRRR